MFHLKFGPQLQYPVFFTMASALFNRLTYLGVGVTAVGALSQHIIYDGKLADPLPCRTCGFSSVRAVLLPHNQTVVALSPDSSRAQCANRRPQPAGL